MCSIKINGEMTMINGIKPTVSNTTKTEKTTTKNGYRLMKL